MEGIVEVSLFPPMMNQGSSGTAVAVLQILLLGLAVKSDEIEVGGLVADGEYGSQTAKAVMTLQTFLGFAGEDVDGNFGPKTRKRLKEQLGIDIDSIMMAQEFAGHTMYVALSGEQFPWPPAREAEDLGSQRMLV